jgi:hypothetical protein
MESAPGVKSVLCKVSAKIVKSLIPLITSHETITEDNSLSERVLFHYTD